MRNVRKTVLPDVSDIRPAPQPSTFDPLDPNAHITEEELLQRVEYMATRREFDHLTGRMLEAILPPFAYRRWGEISPYKRFFNRFQELGVSIVPLEDDSPIPRLEKLDFSAMATGIAQEGLEFDQEQQFELLQRHIPPPDFSFTKTPESLGLDPVDAHAVESLISLVKPQRVLQLNLSPLALHCSRLLARQAAAGNVCQHIIFDSRPSSEMLNELEIVSTVVNEGLSNSPLATPKAFGADDLLILDQCKTVTVGNDLFYIFNQLLPKLKKQTFIYFHPVFLPYHYPEPWLKNELVFWNQQYVLAALVRNSKRYSVSYSGHWLHRDYPEKLREIVKAYDPQTHEPGGFWLRVDHDQGED